MAMGNQIRTTVLMALLTGLILLIVAATPATWNGKPYSAI